MFRCDKKRMDIPSHLNVFYLDKMRFEQIFNSSICIILTHYAEWLSLVNAAIKSVSQKQSYVVLMRSRR